MHVRICTSRGKNRSYRYVQLVQSIRRNGTTTQKILANLGDLPDRTVENLKLALRASREGKPLVVAAESPGLCDAPNVQANLRYLDVAVMLRMWRHWRLDTLMAELLPACGDSAAAAADVVAALTLQRCVAPGSKLFAQRWLPTTALPELLGLPPERFNNTRLHRVLDALFAATPALQRRLPALYGAAHGWTPSAAFIDVTDTYFEGRGCEQARRTRTKAGHRNKWTIGIVLLSDARGYPLRWEVVAGKTKDHLAMGALAEAVKDQPWLQGVPFVCDRAMGRDGNLRLLHGCGLRFLTAAPRNSIETYTPAVPHHGFSELELQGTDKAYGQDVALVTQTARELGLQEVDETLFVVDLGVADLPCDEPEPEAAEAVAHRPAPWAPSRERGGDLAATLRLARQIREKLDAGAYASQAACARAMGLSGARVTQILNLLHLAPDLQQRLLACPHPVRFPEHRLRRMLKPPNEAGQRKVLGEVLSALERQPDQDEETDDAADAVADAGGADKPEPVLRRLRLVAYFNPRMFVDQRRRAQEHLDGLNRFVEALNAELAAAQKSRQEEATRRKIMRQLERYNYSNLFDVLLEPVTVRSAKGSPITSFRCSLCLKPEAWQRRRRYDGFVLLLGHELLSQSAKELAMMYRGKDVIEKDFQTIKSVVKLRPIYSHTDPKVQAHVTLCMLALLLCRSLEQHLRVAHVALSAAACREILSTCHLNRMKHRLGGRTVYTVTEPTTAQHEILKALGAEQLAEDQSVAGGLHL